MDYQKALNILGLTENFTEEELKKAHRKLVNEYHPDRNHSPEAEEKMKVINEAKDCLDKYLKTGQRSYNTTNWNNTRYAYNNQNKNNQQQFDLEQYRRQKYNELRNIIDCDIYNYDFSDEIRKIMEKIQSIKATFLVDTVNAKDKYSINILFNQSIEKIQKQFERLEIEFYSENGINGSDVKEYLNYDCTLKEFYEQLLKMKDKYSGKKPNNNQQQFDPVQYRKQKFNELNLIVEFTLNSYKLSDEIKKIISNIGDVATEFYQVVSMTNKKQAIDNVFDVAIRKIQEKFKNLKTEFYRENGINENDIQETLNYDCTLKEFYEQLLKIKDKYSKESIIDKVLEKELEKYTNYTGYERIKPLVRYCKTKTLHKIKENGFKYTQEDIEKMHQEILKQFEKYYSLEQKMKDLEYRIKHVDNEEIKSKFIRIKNRFTTTIKFDEIETAIKELEDLLGKNRQHVENKNEIDQISKNLISRCYTKSQNYNIADHQEQLGDLIDFLKLILNLFEEGLKQGKPLDFFKMFDEIKFKSIVNDREAIDKITANLNTNKSNIYIKIKCNNLYDDSSFFYLQEDTMLMNKIQSSGEVQTQKITKDDLESEYISIEEFLNQSIFIGEDIDIGYSIIYHNNNHNRMLYLYKNKLYIRDDFVVYKSQNANPSLKPYSDKAYLISLIEKQIKISLGKSFNMEREQDEYFNTGRQR